MFGKIFTPTITNNTSLPKSSGNTVMSQTGIQTSAMLMGEIAGTFAEFGVLAQVENIERNAPKMVGFAKETIKSLAVEPFQRPIEWVMGYTQNIEGKENYQKRMSMSDEDRANRLTNAAFRYGLAGIGAYSTAFAVNYQAAKVMGAPFSNSALRNVLALDAGVHLGAIAFMSSPIMADTTTKLKHSLNGVFKALGFSEEKSEDMSTYSIGIALPNYATFAVDAAWLYRHNLKEMMHDAGKAVTHL